jgi:protein-S-isoprenylcysteine O-methyltransferase Ste14
MKTTLIFNGLTKMILGMALIGLLLLLPAGTFYYPSAWILMGLLFVPMLAVGIVLLCKAPELLKKRLNSKEKESEQKIVILLSSLIFVVGFILAGLDFRFEWTQLPLPVIVVGAILFLFSYGIYIEVMRENAYLSRTVEVQENQKVVDTGLYSIVRHPMYMAIIILFFSMPIVLGSAVAILPFLFIPAVLVKRIKNEEEVLEEGLDGYREYKDKVKYRILPYIW